MATECRRTKQRVNRNRLVRLLIVLVVIAAIAFGIGRVTAPAKTKTVTVTKTVEVPVYSTDKLPEVSDIFYFDVPLSHSLQRFIYEVCADENVPVTLIYAMIEHESQFDPEIISKTDDYGLMQINAVNHTWLNEEYRCADMLDPYWVHNLAQNAAGQPADVIAVKNGVPYLIDCKVCSGKSFSLSRIEENQRMAMTLWRNCLNGEGWFAVKFGENIYMITLSRLDSMISKNLPEELFQRFALTFDEWLEADT